MISQESIEEIKERANLIELAGETISLKRQGSNFVGLCPFHSEKSGSFHIRENGKFYHCFGCGASGNAISFYMQTRGVSFPVALQDLADKFGVKIKFEEGHKEKSQVADKSVYFEINKLASEYFVNCLNKAGPEIKSYLKSRGLKPETLKTFSVGYAKEDWHALCDYLKSRKFSEENIIAAGLGKRNSKGELYDIFRNRIIFPIYSDNRKIAAFGGRLVPAKNDGGRQSDQPKYLNSAENPVYKKNQVFFGLPQALNSIRQEGFVYIVEGYMDSISLWQAGVVNAVATCGTALTQGHIRRLAYLCKRALILFDGDNAGRTAAAKTFKLFLNSGIEASVLFLPEGEDPDSIAGKHAEGTGQFLSSLEKHSPITVYIDGIFSRYAVKSVRELGPVLKGRVAEEVSDIINLVKNSVEKEELLNQAAFKLKLDKDLLIKAKGNNLISSDSELPHQEENNKMNFLSISSLPALDQEILRIVMARKEAVLSSIINNPDLCARLNNCTLSFIQALSEIILNAGSGHEIIKEQIKELLKKYGDSWIKHWKLAYEMALDKNVNFDTSLLECIQKVKKNKLYQSLTELDVILKETSEEVLKIDLAQKRLEIIRQINAI